MICFLEFFVYIEKGDFKKLQKWVVQWYKMLKSVVVYMFQRVLPLVLLCTTLAVGGTVVCTKKTTSLKIMRSFFLCVLNYRLLALFPRFKSNAANTVINFIF